MSKEIDGNDFLTCVNTVMENVEKDHTPDEVDKEAIRNCVYQCLQDGFSNRDTIKYTLFTEHASPSLGEDFACAAMNSIRSNYVKRK